MFPTLVATFVVLMITVAAMAVGVIFGQRRLQGSCGGVPGSACKCSKEERQACEDEHAAAGPDEKLVELRRER